MSGLVSAIVAAAGKGERLSGEMPKQFRALGGQPVLGWSVQAFLSLPEVEEIVIGVREEERSRAESVLRAAGLFRPGIKLVSGGEERQETVWNCLRALKEKTEWVLIHDAARPFVSPHLIRETLAAAKKQGAATPALRPKDTIKLREERSGIGRNLAREHLLVIQTPQAFRADLIREAHEKAKAENFSATDDTALVERLGYLVGIVPGEELNIKITTPADWMLAQALVGAGQVRPAEG